MSEPIANVLQQEHRNTVTGPKCVGLGKVMESQMSRTSSLRCDLADGCVSFIGLRSMAAHIGGCPSTS
jgi:hypothetical protein